MNFEQDQVRVSLSYSKKKQQSGLAPEEEGELRWLFAHPNYPEAQALVKLEYLASEGLTEMSDDVTVYTKDTIGLMPKDGPSDFELYFMSRISELPEFLDAKRQDGNLRVIESIRCLQDRIRTKKFLTGVVEAVQNLNKDKEEIQVCDAGCGAIPVQAIYAALSSPKARCTCIELNPNSTEMAKRIVAAIVLQDRIQIIQTDATKFRAEKGIDVHISETMHSSLTTEPMVQIMSNLAPQVNPEGIKFPNKVTVKAALIKVYDYASPKGYVRIYGNLHHYVEPTWTTVAEYRPDDDLEQINFDLPTKNVDPAAIL